MKEIFQRRNIGMNELMEKDLENAKKDLKDKQEKL
mgnify:CR=1 FL=1|jgi:hypothetical protein|nr:MAG TPA: hypothetical protein [Caudoviricetes sp.]